MGCPVACEFEAPADVAEPTWSVIATTVTPAEACSELGVGKTRWAVTSPFDARLGLCHAYQSLGISPGESFTRFRAWLATAPANWAADGKHTLLPGQLECMDAVQRPDGSGVRAEEMLGPGDWFAVESPVQRGQNPKLHRFAIAVPADPRKSQEVCQKLGAEMIYYHAGWGAMHGKLR